MAVMSRDFWMGLVLGSAAGFVAAMLTAPESGSRTRQSLMERGIELRDRATELGGQAQRTAGEFSQRAAETIGTGTQKAAQTLQQEKGRIQGVVSDVAGKMPWQGGGQCEACAGSASEEPSGA